MNLYVYIVSLFGIIHLSRQEYCENKHNFMPFIANIFTEVEECQGILISRNYILTNGKCVNGSENVIVRLGFKNYPYKTEGQIFVSEQIILHSNFRKVTSTRYLNDIALIKLSSLANLTHTVKPANFLLEEANVEKFSGKNASLVVWKAGYLHTVSGVIQDNSKCITMFADDFDISQHLCIEITNDIFIIHIHDNINHPVIIDNKIIGFAIHYPILNENGGRIYRIRKLYTTLKWAEEYTSINTDIDVADNDTQILEDCRLQNKVISIPHETSTKIEEEFRDRIKGFVEKLILEQIEGIKKETTEQISLIEKTIEEKGKLITQLKTEEEDRFLEIETLLNNKSQEILHQMKDKVSFIQDTVQDKSKFIISTIENKYSALQNLLSQKEEKLKSEIGSKISRLEKLIREKNTQ